MDGQKPHTACHTPDHLSSSLSGAHSQQPSSDDISVRCKDLTQNLSNCEQSAIDAMTSMQQAHTLQYMGGHYMTGDGSYNMGYMSNSSLATRLPYMHGYQREFDQHKPPVLVEGMRDINLPDTQDSRYTTPSSLHNDHIIAPSSESLAVQSTSMKKRLLVKEKDPLETSSIYTDKPIRSNGPSELGSALYQWVTEISIIDCILSDDILLEKAKQLQSELNVADFNCSSGWIKDFRLYYGVANNSATDIQGNDWRIEEDSKPDIGQLNVNIDATEHNDTDYNDNRSATSTNSISETPSQLVQSDNNSTFRNMESNIGLFQVLKADVDLAIAESEPFAVSLDEARQGLFNAIIYLQTFPKVAKGHLKTLEKVLKYIDIHAKKEKKRELRERKVTKERSTRKVTNIIEMTPAALVCLESKVEIGSEPEEDAALSVVDDLEPQSEILKESLNNLEPEQQCTNNPSNSASELTVAESKISHKCPKCTKVCDNAHNLKVHVRVHESLSLDPSNPNRCTICSKVYARLYNLRIHMRTHTGEKPYLCGTCGQAFGAMSGLYGHMATHRQAKCVQCHICQKTFACQRYLKTHLLTHSQDRQFMCTICGNRFLRSTDMKLHMRIHTGYKPYKCSTCDKAFSRFSVYQQHERIHSGVKPYKCSTCNLTFAQKQSLKKHIRVHTGERPFVCKLCGKSFSQNGSLYHHKKTHNR